jgi:hypothetical protein
MASLVCDLFQDLNETYRVVSNFEQEPDPALDLLFGQLARRGGAARHLACTILDF